MKKSSLARRVGAALAAAGVMTVVGTGSLVGAANRHIHGSIPPYLGVVTFATGAPTGCSFLTTTSLIVPLTGNAVMHANGNANGAWFTETLTATAEVVTPWTTTPIATGHLTEWDGGALNQLSTPGKTTLVTHFTADFSGKLTATGAPVHVHGNGGRTMLDTTVHLTGTTLIVTTPGRLVSQHFNGFCS